MSPIIDFHAHAIPRLPWNQTVETLRRRARQWTRPLSASMHRAQTMLRHFPEPARKGLDQLSGIAPLAGLFIESSLQDLKEGMEEAGIHHAVVIAHPPMISNEFVLEAASEDSRIIPAVKISPRIERPSTELKKFIKQGAKLIKVHPAADGETPDSRHYRSILKTAAEAGLPVILHTGCIHSNVLYKRPELGKAELFEPWFEEYADLRFVLAHMNFHEPQIALDLAQKHSNVYVDTSWQPSEAIGEAVRRIGAERVLFGTDWPFVGNNLSVGIQRIEDAVESGWLNHEQSELILGKNAASLLGIENAL